MLKKYPKCRNNFMALMLIALINAISNSARGSVYNHNFNYLTSFTSVFLLGTAFAILMLFWDIKKVKILNEIKIHNDFVCHTKINILVIHNIGFAIAVAVFEFLYTRIMFTEHNNAKDIIPANTYLLVSLVAILCVALLTYAYAYGLEKNRVDKEILQ